LTRPLLAIDGDSLAHRAYHALPKSIRLNALVGFANFLIRLWEAEQPESVLVGWVSSAWWVVGVSPDAFAWPDDTGSTPNPPITAMRVTASDAPAAPIRA